MKEGIRTAKRKVTRDSLIAAAKTLFERDGFFKTTMRDIAKEAKLSTGAIFANFEGKEELWEIVKGEPWVDPEVKIAMLEAENALLRKQLNDLTISYGISVLKSQQHKLA